MFIVELFTALHTAGIEYAAVGDGFTYVVTDEMLQRFAASTIAQRLEWLDEMRTFSWALATQETRARWRRAREFGHQLSDI